MPVCMIIVHSQYIMSPQKLVVHRGGKIHENDDVLPVYLLTKNKYILILNTHTQYTHKHTTIHL